MYGGCNRIRGQAELSAGRIVFTKPFASTRMACPPDRMELEHAAVEALRTAAEYERQGGLLALRDAAGVVLARFQSRPY
jgi:heat shock protein HslJ